MSTNDLFSRYAITISFRDKILGGIPKSKNLLEGWLRGRGVNQQGARQIAKQLEDEVALTTNSEAELINWTTFKNSGEGLYIEERQIKALIREGAFVLGLLRKTGTRDMIRHGTFTKPDRILLLRDDKPLMEPDGAIEVPIHVQTRKGPRSSIKRYDYVSKATVKFDLQAVRDAFPFSEFCSVFEVGQEIGMGASRSQGYGKFDATMKQYQ